MAFNVFNLISQCIYVIPRLTSSVEGEQVAFLNYATWVVTDISVCLVAVSQYLLHFLV